MNPDVTPDLTPDGEPYDITESDQDTDGDMGVSSGIEGPTGPGQYGTTGTRDVSPLQRDPDEDVLPEQASGGPETNPDPPSPPKAAYPSSDPSSKS